MIGLQDPAPNYETVLFCSYLITVLIVNSLVSGKLRQQLHYYHILGCFTATPREPFSCLSNSAGLDGRAMNVPTCARRHVPVYNHPHGSHHHFASYRPILHQRRVHPPIGIALQDP
jgi:hypothetical protein